jgi:hypothetical protein
VDLCEFEASLVCRVNSKTARVTQRNLGAARGGGCNVSVNNNKTEKVKDKDQNVKDGALKYYK